MIAPSDGDRLGKKRPKENDRPTDRPVQNIVSFFFFFFWFFVPTSSLALGACYIKGRRRGGGKEKKRELRTCCECVKLLDAGTTKRCGHNRRQVHTILTDPRLTSANKRPGFSVSNIPKNDNLLFKRKNTQHYSCPPGTI